MTTKPLRELAELLRNIRPVWQAGRYAYVTLPQGKTPNLDACIATIREPEGWSVILPESMALELGFIDVSWMAWITLQVHSDLTATGFTATFSTALSNAGISCNVVAGFYHDHLFVPYEDAPQALAVLKALSLTCL